MFLNQADAPLVKVIVNLIYSNKAMYRQVYLSGKL